MDTSYVAVGTVIYMITDSLTCRPQEKPQREPGPVGASQTVGVAASTPAHYPQAPAKPGWCDGPRADGWAAGACLRLPQTFVG